MSYKIGSLFDGSGGFPLAGAMCGFVPTWAAEVEPYPIAVTRSRFPNMRHLGDVSECNGADIEPVDIICGGSPCQDLSVAGKRCGLKHIENGDEETTRSGLFMEMVRIIKEMRNETNGEYPTFVIWENVLGAFSSNNGNDFRLVLEEFIKIAEPQAVMPAVPKGGWAYADCYCGDGWSLAYRVFDAQYWGVPQRRRRIHLVLDLRGERAGKILFEREGLRGCFTEGRTPWQETTADAERSVGGNCKSLCLNPLDCQSKRIYQPDGVYPTLPAMDCSGANNQAVCFKSGQGAKARSLGVSERVSPTLNSEAGGNAVPSVCYPKVFHSLTAANAGNVESAQQPNCVCYPQVARTLTAEADASPCIDCGQNVVCYDARGNGDGTHCPTLTGDYENRVTDYTAVICIQGNAIDRADTSGCNGKGWNDKTAYTLNTIDRPAVVFSMQGYGDYKVSGVASTLKSCDFKSATDLVVDVSDGQSKTAFGVDCRNAALDAERTHTLQAKANGGQSLNCTPSVLMAGKPPRKYIIRRLTPTECARLQGFPDGWGHIVKKQFFTSDEYKFWLNVRNIHAAINGKTVKDYTEAQMLKWYNKLHTDSAEYKMWGNGIALPPALYCMQGIQDALERMETKKC